MLSAVGGKIGCCHRSIGRATLLPDRKSFGPELLERPTGKKMAFDVEGVENSGLDRDEALHLPFSSSHRLVRVFTPSFDGQALNMNGIKPLLSVGERVGSELVRGDTFRC